MTNVEVRNGLVERFVRVTYTPAFGPRTTLDLSPEEADTLGCQLIDAYEEALEQKHAKDDEMRYKAQNGYPMPGCDCPACREVRAWEKAKKMNGATFYRVDWGDNVEKVEYPPPFKLVDDLEPLKFASAEIRIPEIMAPVTAKVVELIGVVNELARRQK